MDSGGVLQRKHVGRKGGNQENGAENQNEFVQEWKDGMNDYYGGDPAHQDQPMLISGIG
jgi:hypothetical protein